MRPNHASSFTSSQAFTRQQETTVVLLSKFGAFTTPRDVLSQLRIQEQNAKFYEAAVVACDASWTSLGKNIPGAEELVCIVFEYLRLQARPKRCLSRLKVAERALTLARPKVVLLYFRSMVLEYMGRTGDAIDVVVEALGVLNVRGVVPSPSDTSPIGRTMRALARILRHYDLPRLRLDRYGPEGSDSNVVGT